MARDISIVVYYTKGCPATPETIALIRKCISELNLPAQLREVRVTSPQEADAWRFLGSPTVRVEGRDIDPAARDSTTFGFL